jgi:hypothetical protein
MGNFSVAFKRGLLYKVYKSLETLGEEVIPLPRGDGVI